MKKLLLVDRMVRERAGREPLVARGRPDITADEMNMTVGEYIDLSAARSRAVYQAELDHHLEDIFLHSGAAPRGSRVAWKIVEEHRVPLTNTIATWTGVSRGVVRELVRVGVIASLLEVIDARAQPGLDQPRLSRLPHLRRHAG